MDTAKHYADALTWIERNLEWWLRRGNGAPDGIVLVARALSETDTEEPEETHDPSPEVVELVATAFARVIEQRINGVVHEDGWSVLDEPVEDDTDRKIRDTLLDAAKAAIRAMGGKP